MSNFTTVAIDAVVPNFVIGLSVVGIYFDVDIVVKAVLLSVLVIDAICVVQ